MSREAKVSRRKDSYVGKMHNSEEFSSYVHAVSIPMKVIMVAIVVFFAGLIAYCVFGRVPITIDVAAVVDETGTCVCYIEADDCSGVDPGDTVEINGETYSIVAVSSSSICVDDTFGENTLNIGNLEIGDYVFSATVDCALPPGAYGAVLTKELLHPLSVLLTS